MNRRQFSLLARMAILACILIVFAGASAVQSQSERSGTPLRPASTIIPPPEMRVETDILRPPLAGQVMPIDPHQDGIRRRENKTEFTPPDADPIKAAINGYEEIGGDDVVFGDLRYLDRTYLDIASNGDIYLGLERDTDEVFSEWVEIHRSTDGGDTFQLIGSFSSGGTEYDRLKNIDVVEGTVDRIFVTYIHFNSTRNRFDLRVAHADLGVDSPSWTINTVMDNTGCSFIYADLADDSHGFNSYYLYVVASALDGNGDDIWFARSTDFGATWSDPFRVASLIQSNDLQFLQPKVAYGWGGEVHLMYNYGERGFPTFNDAVLYTKASNYGATLDDWSGTTWTITPIDGGVDHFNKAIVTDEATNQVGLLYTILGHYEPRLFVSSTGGDSWNINDIHTVPMHRLTTAINDRHAGRLLMAGTIDGGEDATDRVAYTEAPFSDLTDLSDPRYFGDHRSWSTGFPSIAVDPTRTNSLAISYLARTDNPDYQAAFDAEWRTEPGYPVTEDGFPLALASAPAGPPTVAQLDGDPFGEITWLDQDGQMHLVSHTGVEVGGWPENIGNPVAGSAVAVGDLNGDGSAAMVVGDAIGNLHARNSLTSRSLENFPLNLGNSPVRAAVAPVAAPYPKSIVATCGQEVFVVNYRGHIVESWDLGHDIDAAPSIGDLDDDGLPDIVVAAGNNLVRIQPGNPAPIFDHNVTASTITGPPTLVDLDLDEMREIVIATGDGFVKVYNANGSLRWTYDTGTGWIVQPVAAANIRGLYEPELIVVSVDEVHLLKYDGTLFSGFPTSSGEAGGGYATTPIANTVHWSSSNVIAGSDASTALSWSNFGEAPSGWHRNMDSPVRYSPASGDIDGDGSNELIYLTDNQLTVFDVNQAAQPLKWRRWAQWGSDPGHSFTHAADDDQLVSPVEEEPEKSIFSFAPPSPNPSSGSATFRFSLPADARVDLAVFDVRGRRVRTVAGHEFSAGSHAISFDGRNDHGHPLANGIYFARLQVQGNRNFQETRKLMVVR